MAFKKLLIRQRTSSGFTLVELLIALLILSMLLLTGNYAYQILAERWQKNLGTFDASASEGRAIYLLHGALSGINPYVVVDRKRQPAFLFVGTGESLLASTRNGFFEQGGYEIFRIEKVANGEGKFDIVYQASKTYERLVKFTDQNITFDKSVVMFEAVDSFKISYYGWDDLEVKNAQGGKESWHNSYSGVDKKYLPSKLVVEVSKDGKRMKLVASMEPDVERWLSPYLDLDF